MKILVLGSMRDTSRQELLVEFRLACREIGKALATAGHELVVSGDDPLSVDPYVVEGVETAAGKHRIWLVLPNDGSTFPFVGKAEFKDRIEFLPKRLNDETWGTSRVSLVQGIDAAISLGGGYGTAMTAQLAAAMERPVLPIPRFKGASEELWRNLRRFFEKLGAEADKIGLMEQQWTADNAGETAAQAIKLTEQITLRRVFRTNRVAPQQFVLLSAVVVFMVTWISLFALSPTQGAWTFVMAFLATGLGTSLRHTLRLVFDPAAQLTWFHLLNDWTAGIVLGFALCLLYFVGAVTVTGSTTQIITPPTQSDFQRIAVIMTLLGMTGGLLLEQVAEGLRSWLIDRLPSQQNVAM